MASNVPVIKQLAWVSLLPHLLVMGLLMLSCYATGTAEPVLYGAALYVVLAFALRHLLAPDHRRGMRLVRRQEFAAAIPCFAQSLAWFGRHPWLDRYRYLTLLSSSRMSYREMALCNIAFCYGQLGDGPQAVAYYEQALHEFPGNGLATAGLNLLRAHQPPALLTAAPPPAAP